MTDPTPTRAEVVHHTRPDVTDLTVQEWAAYRSDDAGAVARKLLSENQDLRERAEAAEAEVHTMKTAGIVEVAARNPSVMEYMQHWEGRAERAEAAAWNDAIEAAGNLESIHGYSNAVPRHRIRALRRSAPTEGEA